MLSLQITAAISQSFPGKQIHSNDGRTTLRAEGKKIRKKEKKFMEHSSSRATQLTINIECLTSIYHASIQTSLDLMMLHRQLDFSQKMIHMRLVHLKCFEPSGSTTPKKSMVSLCQHKLISR